jgi:glycosyltransferase involved in cell wall biosynthesis
VAPGELEELYAAADALVTATRYEGFGLPVLEAMARDVPVACSDLPVLREVAGDAAVWLDPGAPASIAAALGEVLAGGEAIERLRAAGRERAARFTWEAAARATADAYERAARERS